MIFKREQLSKFYSLDEGTNIKVSLSQRGGKYQSFVALETEQVSKFYSLDEGTIIKVSLSRRGGEYRSIMVFLCRWKVSFHSRIQTSSIY